MVQTVELLYIPSFASFLCDVYKQKYVLKFVSLEITMQKAQSCRITDGVADIDSVNFVLVIE